ncbi:hypothetical protein [Evansella tamaricis]|uniref:Tubby C-terminal domain-containing protein n=1 Tax=Evansella tamaricis TaxID=2069301 RepID=A0ABS6JCR3_9BACI|nr:hypothetical protein [Evansella tamaricis]MBU9710225.1 hypothetical protein [Evansella tamaricis]
MPIYYYKPKFFSQSTKPVDVYDDDDNAVFKIARYHKSNWDKFRVYDQEHFSVYDSSNNEIAYSEQKTRFSRPKWEVRFGQSLDDSLTFTNMSTFTKHNYEFDYEGKSFELRKTLGSTINYLYVDGSEFASVTYGSKLLSFNNPTVYIEIEDESHIPTEALICIVQTYNGVGK